MGRSFEFRKARKMERWSAMAVKEGGANPDSNARLRVVIQNAKVANMPLENVTRTIQNI